MRRHTFILALVAVLLLGAATGFTGYAAALPTESSVERSPAQIAPSTPQQHEQERVGGTSVQEVQEEVASGDEEPTSWKK